MKVLLVNTLYPPYRVGGAELFVESLADGLAEAGDGVVVAATSPAGEGSTFLTPSGVEVRYAGLANLYWPYGDTEPNRFLKPLHHAVDTYNPLMARKLLDILDDTEPDIVNTHNLNGFSVAAWDAARSRGVPVVHTIHDHYLLCPRSTMFRNGANCGHRCADCFAYSLPRQRKSGLPDAVVGVSRFILDRHLEFGFFDGVGDRVVIPNSCPAVGEDRVGGTAGDAPTFGFMGKLSPEKGIEVLLESAMRVPEEHRRFVVAGKGRSEYEDYLRREFCAPGIEFVGYTQPQELLSRVDVLVVPSLLRESFGRVVIEANSCGVPVAGTDRGGVAELVEDGVTGLVFDPDSPGDLDSALGAFLSDPNLAPGMRDACREKARAYTPEAVTEAYRSLYSRTARVEPRSA